MSNRTLRSYYVYILASRSKRLYVGMTNDLERRLWEHRSGEPGSFTHRYNIERLVYLEEFDDPSEATDREKQVKKWRREKKIWLIESMNPEWNDLSEDWYEPVPNEISPAQRVPRSK